jgi:hypothetical protein
MFKKPILAICLCGVTWAATSQAGFLGNGQDLQFLRDSMNSEHKITAATGSGSGPQDRALVDSQITPSVSKNTPGDIALLADTPNAGIIPAATVPEPGTLYLVAIGLSFFGLTAYRQRRERTEAPPGVDQP